MSRIATEELRRLLTVSEGDNYADAYSAAGRLGAISPQLAAEVLQLREALQALHHAVCGETGFAEAVRLNSGLAYPWPALDIADEMARAALSPAPVMDAVKQGDA